MIHGPYNVKIMEKEFREGKEHIVLKSLNFLSQEPDLQNSFENAFSRKEYLKD